MFKLIHAPLGMLMRKAHRFSTFSKYPFLAELGLKEHNQGAYYNGTWQTT